MDNVSAAVRSVELARIAQSKIVEAQGIMPLLHVVAPPMELDTACFSGAPRCTACM